MAGVVDEDRDGRLDRFDRFCNVAGYRDLAPATGEDAFVPDPPHLHPRGVDLAPRELDGGKVLEAALMLNSLSYDNQFLDTVNQEQRDAGCAAQRVHGGDRLAGAHLTVGALEHRGRGWAVARVVERGREG